jgi:hypothetical protein
VDMAIFSAVFACGSSFGSLQILSLYFFLSPSSPTSA